MLWIFYLIKSNSVVKLQKIMKQLCLIDNEEVDHLSYWWQETER